MATTKREAICEAALRLFAEKGVDATTTREIAEWAGAAEGTLYRHFRSKDELVEWLFEQSAEQFRDALVQAVGKRTAPRSRLQALIRGIFEFAEEHPAAFAYLLSVHHTGVLKNQDSDHPLPMRLFVETLMDGVSEGVFRTVSPVLATGWIVSMAQRAVVFLQSDLLSISREQAVRQTIDAALRIVETTPEPRA